MSGLQLFIFRSCFQLGLGGNGFCHGFRILSGREGSCISAITTRGGISHPTFQSFGGFSLLGGQGCSFLSLLLL